MGDVQALADSISSVGLLHPIVVDKDKRLIVGARRIAAYRLLKRDRIPVNIATKLSDLRQFLRAEADENTCRLPLNPVEAVAIGKAIEKAYRPKAEAAKRSGRKQGGKKAGKGRPDRFGGTSPKPKRDESARTTAVAAKAVGLDRRTYEKAKQVVESDNAEAIAMLASTGKVNGAHRRLKSDRQKEAEAAAAATIKSNSWKVTTDETVIQCSSLITDPPYGILEEQWEPKDLEKFTRGWAQRWNKCGANLVAIFWSQRFLWDGRQWLDNALDAYEFQQLLVWHYANNKSPQSRLGFKQTWEPIFFYRRKDYDGDLTIGGKKWGDELTDFDCHVAAVPQTNFNDVNRKQHPAQKPLSVMRWLVNALSQPGELVADPFCGSGTTGIAAIQLGRRFHGIDTKKQYVKITKERIAAYGKAV